MAWAIDLARNYISMGETLPVFGIILYTDAHPNIKKVLRDSDYWAALNEISGPKWPIFSIRVAQGEYRYPDSEPGSYSMMIPVWHEPAKNKELVEVFELEDTSSFPLLVVFTVGESDELMRTTVSLSDATPDSAFNRLREVLKVTAKAIDGIAEENRSSREGILAAIDYSLREFGSRERMRQGYGLLREIRDWLPI